MLPAPAQEALSTLTTAWSERPELVSAIRTRWRGGSRSAAAAEADSELPEDVRAAADVLAECAARRYASRRPTSRCSASSSRSPPATCSSRGARRARGGATCGSRGCSPSRRRSRRFAIACRRSPRERVVEGPLLDALACAPLLGDGEALALARERRGARAARDPRLGGRRERARGARPRPLAVGLRARRSTAMIREPAHGALRGRVLAARCLEVSVRGMPPTTDPRARRAHAADPAAAARSTPSRSSGCTRRARSVASPGRSSSSRARCSTGSLRRVAACCASAR